MFTSAMITIKNKASIQKMAEAGQRLSRLFEELAPIVVVGASTQEIDSWIEKKLSEFGLLSKMKGYMGYSHVSCVSINDVVVHGKPSKATILKDGDMVKVDVCASWKGYCADMARVFFVGNVPAAAQKLAAVAQAALDKAIEKACPGNRLTDISAAVQQEVERHGYGVVRDFAGHGIGKYMHEDPEILNYGKPGQGPILRPGMTFAIEPMITEGDYTVYVTSDGWTVKTVDKSNAAHVEDTVLVTEHGPKVLTRSFGK